MTVRGKAPRTVAAEKDEERRVIISRIETIASEEFEKRFKVTIEAGEIDAGIDEKARIMLPRVNIAGFRPGRVPLSVVRERYRHSLQRETVQQLISSRVQQILREEKLDIIGYPHIDILPASVAKQVDFTVIFTLKPPIPDLDFSKIHLTRPTRKATTAEVEAQLTSMAAAKREFLPRPGKAPQARAGDRLTIDYCCRIEGRKKEWKESGITYTLDGKRSRPLEKELEKRLSGAKKGQAISFPFTFADDYPESKLAGKSAHFDITVTDIAAVREYAIDDALARAFDCRNIAELRKKTRQRLQARIEERAQQYLRTRLTVMIAGLYDFPLPGHLVDSECRNYIQTRLRRRESKSAPPVLSQEQLEALREDVARRLRFGLIISHVGAKNQVSVNPDRVEQIIRTHLSQDGADRPGAEYYAPGGEGRKKLEASLFEDKVLDFILSQARIENRTMSARQFAEADEKAQEEVQALMAPLVGSGPARGPSASKTPWKKDDETTTVTSAAAAPAGKAPRSGRKAPSKATKESKPGPKGGKAAKGAKDTLGTDAPPRKRAAPSGKVRAAAARSKPSSRAASGAAKGGKSS